MPSAAPAPIHDAAVLWHELPDGSWHHDLLLAARPGTGPDDRCAHAFRIQPRPDQMAPGDRAEVVPLPPHRAMYLALTGEVPVTGRGRARPVRAGRLVHRSALSSDPMQPPQPGERFVVAWLGDPHAMAYRLVNAPGAMCVECVGKEPLA